MRRRLCLLLWLAGCGAPPHLGSTTSGLIGGDVDPGDPAVLMIQAHVPGSNVAHLCSGALVSPHVVMTAAHCVDPATVGDGADFSAFDGATVYPTAPTSAFLPVQATHYDTIFNPDPDVFSTEGHDIGVVILKSPLTIPPLRYNHAPLSPSLVGRDARLVGFGVTSGNDPSAATAGTRREAPTRLNKVGDVLITFEDGTHNICEGDSGGPAFMTVAGVSTIVGVTAYGDMYCNVSVAGDDTRIDTLAPFVDQYVLALDPPAQSNLAAGATCTTDLECQSKICAQIAGHSFCAQRCDAASGMSCPASMTCVSLDEAPLCAPPDLAKLVPSGCSVALHTSPRAAAPWAGLALLLLALWSRRRARQ